MVRVVVGLVICGLVRLATRSVPRASATRTGGRRTRTRHHTRMMPVNSEGGGVRSAAGGAAATHEEETYDDRARIRFCEEARRREDARSHDVIEKQSLKTRVELVDGVERPTRGSKAGGDTTVDKVFRESGVMRHIRGFATWSHAPPCEKVTRRLERSVRDRNALDDRLIDLTRQDVDNVRSALDDGASPEAMYAVVRTDLSRPLPSPVMLRMLSTYDAPGRKALVGASEAEEGERTCAAALRAALRAGGGDDGRRNEARVQQRALTDAAKAICGPNVPDEAGDEHNVLEELVSLYNELLLNTNELHALLERDAQETVALDAFLTEVLQLSPDDEVLLGTTLPRIVLAAGCYSLGTDIGHGLSILHILAQYDDVRLLRGFVPRMTPEQFAIKDNVRRPRSFACCHTIDHLIDHRSIENPHRAAGRRCIGLSNNTTIKSFEYFSHT